MCHIPANSVVGGSETSYRLNETSLPVRVGLYSGGGGGEDLSVVESGHICVHISASQNHNITYKLIIFH